MSLLSNYQKTYLIVTRRNILCIFKLVYGVGLRALRKLFKQIHPKWNNQPSDAAAFDQGRMKLGKEEEVLFKKGDINNWDFSLITSVLRFSKICALEMSKSPGHDLALQELKKIRNELLGHPSTDQMTDGDFNIFWPKLYTHFVTLGADPTDIANIKLQSGSCWIDVYLKFNASTLNLGSPCKLMEGLESMNVAQP